MKRVLITGGFGYLGGRIARHLTLNTNLAIRLGTRAKDPMRPDWLKNGDVVYMDLLTPQGAESACEEVDAIIHLAAVNEIESARDPLLAMDINGCGTLRLLQAAQKKGVRRFIYFSTAHVYGSPLKGVLNETAVPRPMHPYAITHRVAEDFVLAAHSSNRITGIVLRLSNGFGAPQRLDVDRWTLLVNDLCRQAVMSGKIHLLTSGLQVRDFISMVDICRAVDHFIVLPEDLCGDGLFNLGGEHTLRVIDMAEMIVERYERLFGVRLPIHRPEPENTEHSEALKYSIEKMKRTGFKPEGHFDSEIDATLRLCCQAVEDVHATK